ncbi:MAG: arginine--tRNA ligase [Balneolaceae bacterium]
MNDYLHKIITESLQQFELEEFPDIQTEAPKVASHGDASTNIAMMLAKPLRGNPRAIAQQIVDGLKYDAKKIAAVEIAGPGFINFRYSEDYLFDELASIIEGGADYGKTTSLSGKKILIEFVSANPTGPLTVGHGRNAVLGDTVARLLEWTGAEVDREYYFNDAGRQMRVLGQSVQARYLEQLGKAFAFPEGGYEGEYIKDIAAELISEKGEKLAETDDWVPFKEKAKDAIFSDISTTLERMDINMDSFFNEHSLYEDGSIDNVVAKLRELDLAYDEDGATWFRTTKFGKEVDTVLIKSTGEPTYRLPDIAYHVNKLERGYDLCVDVFGADHIATYPDVLSGLEALDYDTSKVDVIVYQFVTIVQDGQPYKMSTRKANFVTLNELMDEVGADITRFFFLMRSPNTHLEFDITHAKEAGEKNPVFYLQYAHARIASILRKADEVYAFGTDSSANLELLTHKAEIALIKTMLKLPDIIANAAEVKEPHRLINYLNDVASAFTSFYHDCRIVGVDEELAKARIELSKATAQILRNGLTILGISAPDRM